MKSSSLTNLLNALLAVGAITMARAELLEFNFLATSGTLSLENKLFTDTEAPGLAAATSTWAGISIAGMAYVGTPDKPVYLTGSRYSGLINLGFSQGSAGAPQQVAVDSDSLKGPHLRLAGRWLRAPGLQQQIPAAEYNALADVYTSTHGHEWQRSDGWNNPVAASWYGVTVSNLEADWESGQLVGAGTVLKIVLSSNGLRGSIPGSVGNLANLIDLTLSNE